MSKIISLVAAILTGIAVLMAYVRLAPDDPVRWNIAVATTNPATPGACVTKIILVPKGARATCLLPGNPVDTLAKLDATAQNAIRTTRLTGTPTDGRITWISRSRLMGYPDYITAEVSQTPDGTRLDIFARQRYGNGDAGVNAARLQVWLSTL